jgi:hypothetical protein
MIALSILGFIGFFALLGVALWSDNIKPCIVSLILSLVCLAGAITSTVYYDQHHLTTYNVVKTSTYYGEGESINRVWLESDGKYFWVEIPACDKSRFAAGKQIDLCKKDMENWIISKGLSDD